MGGGFLLGNLDYFASLNSPPDSARLDLSHRIIAGLTTTRSTEEVRAIGGGGN